ncbi:hypothetical protein LEP1GSC036_2289 [Leptospira weilii str. 2006001853]|uniref:Uncharacterized protein n=3 Tax=Leptospira weilii TaxID=28184 RepID=A0A828Z3T3_9LEPT|nr:hypothetical protein LEP1GSC036_2289 [Leptospira weilii str. 2006001853]EMM71117.1 hypothetical protein LEP1GSC038_0644 [Leptospira weilii str. 2006001855]EMN89589.1 hypothetical protein LEP1GSC108_3772 [Leptospira weilii str. UI 13098]
MIWRFSVQNLSLFSSLRRTHIIYDPPSRDKKFEKPDFKSFGLVLCIRTPFSFVRTNHDN